MLGGRSAATASLLSIALIAAAAEAAVERIEIAEREPFAAGASFGRTGAYERVRGTLRFAVSPEADANHPVVDLDLAPRGADGLVRFSADFLLLRPADPARGNGALFYDVTNRGNVVALYDLDDASPNNNPRSAMDAGNGFLLEAGYTLLWSGWNWDVVPGDGRLTAELPVARERNGRPVEGPVVYEFVADRPVNAASYVGPLARGYPPAVSDDPDAKLTVRDSPRGEPRDIPRDRWRFAPGRTGVLESPDGFAPGKLYELVYRARNTRVVGLGFAAVRDALSFFRYEQTDRSGSPNPLAEAGRSLPGRALIFGVSQSGRFIRHMLWEGMHVDEAGRPLFDGAFVVVAGAGRGSFNHRFAQTTRHPNQFEEHGYPADLFPFAMLPQRDPVTGRTAGLLDRARSLGVVPRIVQVNTSQEYWGRSASLVHTDVEGKRDAPEDASVRTYHLAGAAHIPAVVETTRRIYANCLNPLDWRPQLRALLLALDRWTREGVAPPPSTYPRIEPGTLVSVAEYKESFPRIPGLLLPESNLAPPRLDLGPRFAGLGIADRQPPALGPAFATLVPRADTDGNDLGGIVPPELAAPLGTYLGWNTRSPEAGSPTSIARYFGSFVPFAPTRATRLAAADPRPSLEERYASPADHERLYRTAAEGLVRQGFLRNEEIAAMVERSATLYRRILARKPGSASCAYLAAPG